MLVMEKEEKKNAVFTPMTKEEKTKFNSMMSEIQKQMDIIRMENIRMSREAEHASSMAFLNC